MSLTSYSETYLDSCLREAPAWRALSMRTTMVWRSSRRIICLRPPKSFAERFF
jgi:hypothetical protein